jgi:hypothetical protein
VPARGFAFAALGMAADLDLLIGRHSQFTHSIGMAMLVGAAAFTWLSVRGIRRVRGIRLRPETSAARRAHLVLAVAMAAAYGSHVLLDWLAQDATPPWGITALWPFSSAYYLSRLDVFSGISRQPWLPGAAWHDVRAVARELVLLGSLAVAAWWMRRGTARQILPTATRTGVQPLPPRRGLPVDGESR